MTVITREESPPGTVVCSCPELHFGYSTGALPLRLLGIEPLRRQAQFLHPERPLTDALDRTALHLSGVLRNRGRENVVVAARLTQLGENSFIPQIYGGPLPSMIGGDLTAELSWLVVGTRNRGYGMGPAMVLQAIDLLHKKGWKWLVGVLQVGMPRGAKCSADTTDQIESVRRMYQKLGFVIHDEDPPRPALDSGVPLVPFSYDVTKGMPPLPLWKALGLQGLKIVFIPEDDALSLGIHTPAVRRRLA